MTRFAMFGGACLAILLLASAATAADSIATGKIKGVDADKKEFVLTDADGKDWTFKLGDKVVMNRGGKESQSELAAGDLVWVHYDKGVLVWTAKYILVQEGDSKNWELAHGAVKGYEGEKKLFTYTNDEGRDTILAAGNGKVWVNNKEAKFADLKIGERCLLIVSKDGGKSTLKTVMCERK